MMETPEKQAPLRITITATGQENLILRALLRQAVPMLLKPEAFRPTQRCQLAQDVTLLLNGPLAQSSILPSEDGTSTEYEPGCLTEMEDPW
jgi:hypothetical protein